MLKKKNNKKGFTLMEMLIVVAIIAVLVAIAIPTFSSALTKAKEAADVANIRATYAEWQVSIMTDDAVTFPTDVDKFLAAPGGNTVSLNAKSLLTCTHTAKSGTTPETLAVTYAPTVLNNKTAYTWTLTNVD